MVRTRGNCGSQAEWTVRVGRRGHRGPLIVIGPFAPVMEALLVKNPRTNLTKQYRPDVVRHRLHDLNRKRA